MSADWNGADPETGTMSRKTRRGVRWARRKVRADGTVKFAGRIWQPPADAVVRPVPGEWLLLFDYGPDYRATCGEWTAPADPDGYIRRYYWEPA